MANKDATEKLLEDYNDVFADIANALLFKGQQIIQENDLTPERPRSIYKADGKFHEQERDVAKYWRNSTIRIALLGFENQTADDADMPLRVISYDGASYKQQLLDKKAKQRYPVTTIVLYFGTKRHWKSSVNIVGSSGRYSKARSTRSAMPQFYIGSCR